MGTRLMSTRGAFGFRIDGADKVTYNHFDSYLSGLGATLLSDLRKTDEETLVRAARRIRLVDDQEAPTAADIERYGDWANTGVSSGRLNEWYVLLREAQGRLAPYLDGLDVMIDGHDFLKDSLFCEYAYIVNLDTKMFEVYTGYIKRPEALGRYASADTGSDYHGVALLALVPLDKILDAKKKQVDGILTGLRSAEDALHWDEYEGGWGVPH